jgi:NAD(P)-dependent dehydrogenase (short-subunit alcohol dehydrogenase family)
MVKLSDVRKSNSVLETSSSLVAVFTGGTSGIGEATIKALAANAKSPKVYIIGRNEASASRIIEKCVQSCPGGSFTFVKADLSLLRNVDVMCDEIKRREQTGRLDLLFMSQGYITLQGRKGEGYFCSLPRHQSLPDDMGLLCHSFRIPSFNLVCPV